MEKKFTVIACRWFDRLNGNTCHSVTFPNEANTIYVPSEAHAKLIVAAPELLAACERMMVGITGKSTLHCSWYEGIEHDAADEAKVAIDKATK